MLNPNCFAFGASMLGYATIILVHRVRRTHSVKGFILFAIYFFGLSFALRMSSQHAAKHDKISATTKSFGNISSTGTTAISHNIPTNPMSGIGTLNHRAKLGITNTSLNTSSTHRTTSNTDLDNICSI
jgi:hypothetical protein